MSKRMECKVYIYSDEIRVTCRPLVSGVTPDELYREERRVLKTIGPAWLRLMKDLGTPLEVTAFYTKQDHEDLSPKEAQER